MTNHAYVQAAPPTRGSCSWWQVRAHLCLHHTRQERRPRPLTSDVSPGDPVPPPASRPQRQVSQASWACWLHPLPLNHPTLQGSRLPSCFQPQKTKKVPAAGGQSREGAKVMTEISATGRHGVSTGHKATWQVCLFKKRRNVNDERRVGQPGLAP